ncbi:hypothetical protein KI387_027054, partial [Taxus chinensis]
MASEKCTDVVTSEASVGSDGHHIVEIPVDEDQIKTNPNPCERVDASSPQHPLEEIADSRGHLLLLKLWQREEEVVSRRIESKDSRIESIGTEIFQLICFSFVFHGIVLTLLFTGATHGNADTCERWWIPGTLSFVTSFVLACAIQHKVFVQGNVRKMLQRDKTDLRALNRCIQELRMKGISFDLSKEPQPAKNWKSSSVEIKSGPLRWCSQFSLPVAMTFISGLTLARLKGQYMLADKCLTAKVFSAHFRGEAEVKHMICFPGGWVTTFMTILEFIQASRAKDLQRIYHVWYPMQ